MAEGGQSCEVVPAAPAAGESEGCEAAAAARTPSSAPELRGGGKERPAEDSRWPAPILSLAKKASENLAAGYGSALKSAALVGLVSKPLSNDSPANPNEAALTVHCKATLQRLINHFVQACKELGLTISLTKTDILGQDIASTPHISIGDRTLEVVDDFVYLDSTITSKLSVDAKLDKYIGTAATAMACLPKRIWENVMLVTRLEC